MRSEWLENLAQMLVEDEGCTPKVIDDATGLEVKAPIGRATIGVGWNVQDVPLPEEVIRLMLDISIRRALQHTQDIFPNLFDYGPARSHALVNLTFNLGPHGIIRFQKFCEAVRNQDWQRSGKELQRSRWFFQVGSRAERIISLLTDEEYKYAYRAQ